MGEGSDLLGTHPWKGQSRGPGRVVRGWGGDGLSFSSELPALRTDGSLGAGKPSGLAAEADSSLGGFLEALSVCVQCW